MLVLERYARLLEEAGEDISQVKSEIHSDEIPLFSSHILEYSFKNGNFVFLCLQENVRLYTVKEYEEKGFAQRSILQNILFNNQNCSLDLVFNYGETINNKDYNISLEFDAQGKVLPRDNGETSFQLENSGDPKIFQKRFSRIDTSVGADFKPIARQLIALYKDMKKNSRHYKNKINRATALYTLRHLPPTSEDAPSNLAERHDQFVI